MEWLTLSKSEAKQITNEWNNISKENFDEFLKTIVKKCERDLNNNYTNLRKDVIQEFYRIAEEISKNPEYRNREDYCFDYKMGISFYRILKSYGFSQRLASYNEIWIYLSIKVFPDIVMFRYQGKTIKNKDGEKERINVNEDRFWKNSRRIYLKVIWWYIFLSLQDGESETEIYKNTEEVIKNNNTDIVVQLVERPGAGYRVDLFREIIRYYSTLKGENNRDIFRKVMVLNTAKTIVIEPQLYVGGIQGYVKFLFDYFE